MRAFLVLCCAIGMAGSATSVEGGAVPLSTRRVAVGLALPVFATHVPGDPTRMFVCEQNGRIRVVNLLTLQVLPTPFLNIDSEVFNVTGSDERGLLGMAFHPDYATNGHFYVYFSNNSGNSVIRRYTVSTNPNVANAASGLTLLTLSQPAFNHNGGMIAFGPNDGYLYIGFGDGGGGGDTFSNGQNPNTFHSKVLRLDVNGQTPYAIPPTNPFVGPGAPLDEIWLQGLRNPWRWSFDRATGDMYIADVGQGQWEEINFVPAGSPGGLNFGWSCMEGNHCFAGAGGCVCNATSLTDPIYEYAHTGGRCSITGGYVYRGMAMPAMAGTYFFAEWCTSEIWSFVYNGTSVTNFQTRTAELDPPGVQSIQGISSFGEDAAGEIYICDRSGGELFKIVPADIATQDCNNNFIVDSVEFALGLALDCNSNSTMDACEILADPTLDCDDNGQLDSCEFAAGTAVDCNSNGIIDSCDIESGLVTDCNGNGLIDSCELLAGTALDCNANGIIDSCEIAQGTAIDCDEDGVPDSCQLAAGTGVDCNGNGLLDTCDIDFGLAVDCNGNGQIDSCELTAGTALDCNANQVPDACDIASGFSQDVNLDGIPDECTELFIRGDCNVDNAFNIADAVALLDFLFNPAVTTVPCVDACDSNDSGGVNVADAIYSLGALFSMGPLPLAPHPQCGPDPTVDALDCASFTPVCP